MPYRGCREGTWGKRLPQRHRNVGFAAVVASATAQNHGFCCRCGKGERREDTAQGLWRGYTGNADAATAQNHGFCCRCGKEERREDAAQGL